MHILMIRRPMREEEKLSQKFLAAGHRLYHSRFDESIGFTVMKNSFDMVIIWTQKRDSPGSYIKLVHAVKPELFVVGCIPPRYAELFLKEKGLALSHSITIDQLIIEINKIPGIKTINSETSAHLKTVP